jgi:FtsP/CotA-like multicopper oxidase with cupredoxin domain
LKVSGGGTGMMGGMSLPHPIHLHALQFQVIERIISSSTQEGWNTLSDGFVDEGWHDTVLVYPGEKVKILVKFEDFTGLYLYHCHNLEHEDMGMMRNYLVEE